MSVQLVPSKGCEEEYASYLSPSFWWFAGNLWFGLVEASPQFLPLSSRGVLLVGMSVSKFPLFIKTPVRLD